MNTFVERFLEHLVVERGLSDKTRAAYGTDLAAFLGYLARQRIHAPEAVDRACLLGFLEAEQRRGLAEASLARRVAALKAFFGYLHQEEHLPGNPTEHLDTPTLWRLLPETLSCAEVDQLLEQPAADTRDGVRDRAILELLYASGLRVSELASLRREHLYLEEGFVRIRGKGLKVRVVPVGSRAVAALRRYLQEARPRYASAPNEDAVFLSRRGRSLSRESLWRLVKKHARGVGVEGPLSPHSLRHAFATHLLANGAPIRVIQEMLGHADIATTQIYTHVDQDRLVQAHRHFHPRA